MNFWSRWFGKTCECRPHGQSSKKQIYLIDASGLIDNRAKNGNVAPNPRDHFQILKTLAQFATREGIAMTAVFTGRPLREAADGEDFKGVQVFYAETPDTTGRKLMSLGRDKQSSYAVTLLTADEKLEKEALSSGFECMRLSTFRKAVEEKDDSSDSRDPRDSRDNRDSRDGRDSRSRSRNDRNNRDRNDRPANNGNTHQDKSDDSDEEKQNKSVLDLIDPV